jgi:hypothetical protein
MAFVAIGYWRADTSIDWTITNATIDTAIAAFHAANIKVFAWVENEATINLTSSIIVQKIYKTVISLMGLGFDGYNDDIEDWIGSTQTDLNYLNNETAALHNIGKLMTADVGYDWTQSVNNHLYIDHIASMFYSSRSKCEDPQGAAYWQEDFGEYGGSYGSPTSPMIIGIINYYGNTYPLTWQLNWIDNALATYSHPSLVGFCIWLYEYISQSDWQQWDYWINRIGVSTPTAYYVTVNSSPPGTPATFNNCTSITPFTDPWWAGTYNVSAASQMINETNHILSGFGVSDHTGGGEGYNVYTYFNGPFNITSPININSVYVYASASGNIKVAIYNGSNWYAPPSGWAGTEIFPEYLFASSGPVAVTANKWYLFNFTMLNLPAGYYFIGEKGDATGILGDSSVPDITRYGEYGHSPYTNEAYTSAWSNPCATIGTAAMGSSPSSYVPSAPESQVTYYFNRWEDNSTSLSRAVTISSNTTLTAYYSSSAVPEVQPYMLLPLLIITTLLATIVHKRKQKPNQSETLTQNHSNETRKSQQIQLRKNLMSKYC